MKNVVLLKPGDRYYPAGFGCGFCHTDDKPVFIDDILFETNKNLVDRGQLGARLAQGICCECAEALAALARDQEAERTSPNDKIRAPNVRRGDVTVREGVLDVDRDDWPHHEGYRLTLTPVGHQLTKTEFEVMGRGVPLAWSEEESLNRRVLCRENSIDLCSLLAPYEGKQLKILFCEVGKPITREESDRNELAARPDDPYVIWFSDHMPFVCPDGRAREPVGHHAVAAGSDPCAKLRQLDKECPCGRTGHRQSLHKNRVTDLEKLEVLF